jgi:hypothetical protein
MSGVGLIFIVYEIVLYGISAYILQRSPSLKEDFLWCLALAVPFALTEILWLRGWRIAEDAGMSVWTADGKESEIYVSECMQLVVKR